MNLGIIAHNSKKVLIEDFCIAYKNILAKHEVYATGTTGRRIEEATSLHVHKFLAGSIGGDKQFMEMVERQDLDMVILFYNPVMIDPKEPDIMSIVKRCDQYNIPVATNIATAELLILRTCQRRPGLETESEMRVIAGKARRSEFKNDSWAWKQGLLRIVLKKLCLIFYSLNFWNAGFWISLQEAAGSVLRH